MPNNASVLRGRLKNLPGDEAFLVILVRKLAPWSAFVHDLIRLHTSQVGPRSTYKFI